MKFFTTLNSKNIIATLHMVTIEKPELTLLLTFIFPCVPRICPHTLIKTFKSFNGMFLYDRDLHHERVKGKFF